MDLPVCSGGGMTDGVCCVSLILRAEGSVTLNQPWLLFQPLQTIRSQPRPQWLVFALGRVLHTELMASGEIRAFFFYIHRSDWGCPSLHQSQRSGTKYLEPRKPLPNVR